MSGACEWCGSTARDPQPFIRADGTHVLLCSKRGNDCVRERLRNDGVRLLERQGEATPRTSGGKPQEGNPEQSAM